MSDRIGDFTLQEKIAEGGMGVVFRAWQESLQRLVALKILKRAYADDESFVARFEREARSAAALVHPNIIQIYAVGEENGRHYFAMEYVKGRDLKRYLREKSRLTVSEALDIIIKVADALTCAEAADIVHRDIKPANIMLTERGRVKVTDFGLAKCLVSGNTDLTQGGKVLGTVNYMSPEQGLGKVADVRSDIYSLGAVFFELLTGRPPFKGEHPTSIIYMHVYEAPPPVRFYCQSVPEAVETLICRMMAKDPEDRFAGTEDLVHSLEGIRTQFGLGLSAESRLSKEEMPTLVHSPVWQRGARRVLVVDDDRTMADLCVAMLEAMGYGAMVAYDGVEGLELWRTTHPDLVLLDLNMPKLGGLALLEERRTTDLPGSVLVMSAQHDRSTIERVVDQRAAGYLLKPFSPEDLKKKIKDILGQDAPATE